jgi:hypothetical protein
MVDVLLISLTFQQASAAPVVHFFASRALHITQKEVTSFSTFKTSTRNSRVKSADLRQEADERRINRPNSDPERLTRDYL